MSNRIYIRFNKIKGFILFFIFVSLQTIFFIFKCCLLLKLINNISIEFRLWHSHCANEMAIDGGKVNNHVHR